MNSSVFLFSKLARDLAPVEEGPEDQRRPWHVFVIWLQDGESHAEARKRLARDMGESAGMTLIYVEYASPIDTGI